MERRDFMSAVAALAGTRWDNEDYDVANVENWDDVDCGSYCTGSFSPLEVNTNGDGPISGWLLEDDELDERMTEVFYTSDAVFISVEGRGENIYSGSRGGFEPDQAKQVAAALYQAAEELQQRQEVADGEE